MKRLAAALFMAFLVACSTPKEPPAAKEPTAAEVLGVKPGFTPRYKLLNTERPDIAGAPRLVVRVVVPRGLSREELDLNVRHALLHFYQSGPVKFGAVSVGAFTSEKMSLGADAALGEFAPNGQWSAASTDVPLSKWQATITLADLYFQERKEFPVGSRAVLVASEFSETVDLSRKAGRWLAEDIVAELKPGASAVVVGSEDFGPAGVRYEVETTSGPKHRGWVHAFELKAE